MNVCGRTALGPGIATAVCMATEGKPGSSVVICTDGLANVGLGAFEEGGLFGGPKVDVKEADKFYESVGNIA